ncbi:hypothetical protein N0X72_00565 [Streptomyces carpaticus]|uniref:hypothetical protein n=1 Tax=Streptomyces carpaticus TaxID=285558 RepID=UPI002206F294|nr:hypothetical protein N0X72_00565 [Streptomyces carpaticus]
MQHDAPTQRARSRRKGPRVAPHRLLTGTALRSKPGGLTGTKLIADSGLHGAPFAAATGT